MRYFANTHRPKEEIILLPFFLWQQIKRFVPFRQKAEQFYFTCWPLASCPPAAGTACDWRQNRLMSSQQDGRLSSDHVYFTDILEVPSFKPDTAQLPVAQRTWLQTSRAHIRPSSVWSRRREHGIDPSRAESREGSCQMLKCKYVMQYLY